MRSIECVNTYRVSAVAVGTGLASHDASFVLNFNTVLPHRVANLISEHTQ